MLPRDRQEQLFEKAFAKKQSVVGEYVYLRGLIELSNICTKNCSYCGIRKDNVAVDRYQLDQKSVIEAAKNAAAWNFGSIVIQSGENCSDNFISFIEDTLYKIGEAVEEKLFVTLSLGEQSEETYRRWFKAGADRYLLRIESSNRELFESIHPNDGEHSYDRRLEAIKSLQRVGYQTGTGFMIGVPGQTIEHMVDDIQFLKDMDIDMVGMGPFLSHADTPMGDAVTISDNDKFDLTLKMIASLRLEMEDINIAATTALQAIKPFGREDALMAGANVIMPNITPGVFRENYNLYPNKPKSKSAVDNQPYDMPISSSRFKIGYGIGGSSLHYLRRNSIDR